MSLNIDVGVTVDGEGNVIGLTSSIEELKNTTDSTTSSVGSFSTVLTDSTRVGASAMIALDRIQISMDAVSNAQNRQELAQMRLNDAVTRYGAGSDQAQKANLELENSTRSLEIAQEREQVRMTYGALIVIPGMVRGLRDLMDDLDLAALKEDILTGTIDANTAAMLANLAVATLGVGVPIALMAMTFAESQAPQAPNLNVYGNVNVNGVGVGSMAGIASTAQYAAQGNP